MSTSTHPLCPPLEQLLHAYEHPLDAARAWKREGGKVIGYISSAVPRELIVAAGAFPVLISGDPKRSTELADEWMEEQFDPMVRSIFELALAGDLEFLDLLIVPRVADSFLRLYLYLKEVERLGVARRLPRVVLFDLLQTSNYSSGKYNLARVHELQRTIDGIVGRAIVAADLRSGVAQCNDSRRSIAALAPLRRDGSLAGSLALKIMGAAHTLAPAEHARLTHLARAAGLPRPKMPGPRVVVAGNAQDNPALYELLEAQHFSVVGDYHWLGDADRAEVEDSSDPWLAVTDRYQHHSLTSRRFPHPPDELVAYAQSVDAQGVVLFLFEQEEALTWDAPRQVQALERAGIAPLVLDHQSYLPRTTTALLASVASFGSRLRSARREEDA
jgi:benzoyl-CoA reductase/2-hydroxyglutaryl-CoA dehydratase subunit BcrC/BadD/HgdB